MMANARAILLIVLPVIGGDSEARAQGLLDRLFGGLQPRPSYEMPPPEPPGISVAPPSSATAPGSAGPRQGGAAFCVRLCDGRFFPVQATPGASAAQLCTAFCPRSPTKIFSGSDIKNAVAADGTRYAALPHAFAYRERMVADCSCDGIDSVGLAHIDPVADPALRSGDMVATQDGLAVFKGWNARQGERPSPSFAPAPRSGAPTEPASR